MAVRPPASERERRRAAAAASARAAEKRGDDWAANEAWRRHQLITDGGRDADDLLAEGIQLSRAALRIAGTAGRTA